MAEYVVEVERIDGNGYTAYRYGRPKEEIIRCRDCKFSGWNFLEDETKDDCFKHVAQDGFMLKIKPDDFCTWAERVE